MSDPTTKHTNGHHGPAHLAEAKEKTGATLLMLPPERLRRHPQNLRLYYSDEEVADIAASIKAHGGVLQALLVVPDPERPGGYLVVDGNMRLAGGKYLGEACPLLKCEVVDFEHADQLLVMASTTSKHYPKDSISQAKHFFKLKNQEFFSVEEIAERTGISTKTIYNLLPLLDLDEPIQELISAKKLSPDPKVRKALLSIADPHKRIFHARRFARNGTSIKWIIRSCRHVVQQEHLVNHAPLPKPRQVAARPPVRAVPPVEIGDSLAVSKIEEIARRTLCPGCRADGLGQQCWTCPGPYEFIQHLTEMVEFRQAAAPANGNGKAA